LPSKSFAVGYVEAHGKLPICRRLRKNIRQTFDQLEHHSRRIDLKKDLP
jgi:hypothetical protein